MAGLKEIKIRIKSVKNTKKITYAMKLVSATKMRTAQEAVLKSKDYSQALRNLLASVLSACNLSEMEHPFLVQRPLKKTKLIVLGANRGLCGAYNSSLNKAITSFMSEHCDEDVKSIIIGSKQVEHYQRFGFQIDEAITDVSENPAEWPLLEISKKVEAEFEKGDIDAAYLIYTNFKSALSMTPKVVQLLPVTVEDLQQELLDAEVDTGLTLFEPNAQEVFAALLPRLVRISMTQGALDAKASEHASRMTAMDSATKNAGELIESLTLTYNKLRQAGITAEILDIVGGANALE